MLVKGRPLGIWVISSLLVVAAFLVIYFSREAFRFELITVIALGLSGLFVFGLMFRVAWLYLAFLLFLSLGMFLQLVAILLILSAHIAGGGIAWLQLAARYWQGAVVMIIVCGTIFYLGRSQVREYFSSKQNNN